MPKRRDVLIDLTEEMALAYALNDRMNQIVLQHLDSRAWRAQGSNKGARTIAAIFVHVHNIRCKWLRLSAPHLKIPARLDRTGCTQEQAASALAQSAARCCEMLTQALSPSHGQIPKFVRDGWASPWHCGAAMFGYMMTHDAHHRGQACMLAHQLGFPLSTTTTAAMWQWERLSKEYGVKLGTGTKGARVSVKIARQLREVVK